MSDKDAWKTVLGWEGFYEVSDLGRVRSLDRTIRQASGVYRRFCGRILKPQKHTYGYRIVALSKKGKTQRYFVHRLVLLAFVGPAPDGMEACHDDGKRDNNRLENLRWDTRKNNNADKIKHATQQHGESHGGSKLTAEQIKIIRVRYAKDGVKNGGKLSTRMLAVEFGLSHGQIKRIINRKSWNHI